jgi:hypothetical protein
MAIAESTPSASVSFEPSTAETPPPVHISRQVRYLTVSSGNPGSRASSRWELGIIPSVPLLRVQGRWMEAAGFEIGARVRVQVAPGRLLFEVEQE